MSSCLTRAPATRWIGPRGFALLSAEVDFRAGGAGRGHLRSPEGRHYRLDGVRIEMMEPERIVLGPLNLRIDGRPLAQAPGNVTFRPA